MPSIAQILLVAILGLVPSSLTHMLQDPHQVEDLEHLKSHLHGAVDLGKMSMEELRFNYFKAHDVDSNNKLDGCELTQAFVDYHAEEISPLPKMFSDEEIETVIDQILTLEDKDSDGFIDYGEFVASQDRLHDAHHHHES